MEIRRMDFFMVPRQLFAEGAFKAEPYSKREALLDLIQMAAIESKAIVIGGAQTQIERGQVFASIRFLAKKWGWSVGTVVRTLSALEAEHFIERERNTATSIISICNFDLYSGERNTQRNASGTDSGTPTDTEYKNKDKEQEEKEKVTKVTQKKNDDVVNRIYAIYPTKCPISGRSLGKCSKDKAKIATLLKTRTPEDIELTIREYIVDCKNHNTYLKNFGTLLNNLPEREEPKNPAPAQTPPPQPEKRSPELIAIDAMNNGVTDMALVRQAIVMVWDGITEDKIQHALWNAGYRV